MQDIAFRMADDKSKVRLEVVETDGQTVSDTLWAFEMDTVIVSSMIERLALIRAVMNDPVPMALDRGKLIFREVQLDAAWAVMDEGPMSKRFMLALRHPGYGWVPFAFTKKPAQQLTDAMAMQVLRIVTLPPGLITTSGSTKL